jgi:two-component system LytT family response regulator
MDINSSLIAFPIFQGYIFCAPEDIIYCQADGSYTTIFLKDRDAVLVSKSIGQIEKLLTQDFFVRIHQSFLVNIYNLKGLVKEDGLRLVLHQGVVLPVANSKKELLLSKFKKL